MKNHDDTVIEMLRDDPDMALDYLRTMTAVIKATGIHFHDLTHHAS